ncbi:nitroreductase [Roseovarius sp. A21]|uniref:Nitroreductase n=1 Tax=Roseovarius bejariae TaxID=2576383 RepID=A0A844CSU9_9RHOB|nr:nitroreductase [Roseovarius bejariae]MRU14306.1 nitroreductase [Roseovarius bejariae]
MIDDAKLHRMVARAIRAPSSHNSQPWLFRPTDGGIDLLADRTRALPVTDPEDRELTISCGCALFGLRVAAAAEGLGAHVTPLPDGPCEERLAHLAFNGPAEPGLRALASVIDIRQTWRKAFSDKAIGQDILTDLHEAVAREGAWLSPFESEKTREATANLVAEGDAAQWADPSWRRELAQWMHPRRAGDGLALPGLAVPVARMVIRRFDMGYGVAARDSDLAGHSPLLAVLGSEGDTPTDWLAAGQALHHMLLLGAKAGLAASYLNQPIEVIHLRPRLQALAGHPGYPQILLRMGHAAMDDTPSPRRDVKEVLIA